MDQVCLYGSNLPHSTVCLLAAYLHVLVAFVSDVLDLQLGAGVADDAGVLRQQFVAVQPPDGRVDLLLGQIPLWMGRRWVRAIQSAYFLVRLTCGQSGWGGGQR